MVKNSVPLISIVLLNQNGLVYLKEIIKPILNLSYSNFEIIIVDNGSVDGSLEFLKKFKNIKLVELDKNIGYSAGKNLGVKFSKGEYVLILDNDIMISEKLDFLDLVDVCKSELAFIQIPLVDINKENTSYYGIFFSKYGVNFHKKEVPLEYILNLPNNKISIGAGTGGCLFCSRESWNKVGGFDESQFFNIDDIDLGPRVWISGFKYILYTKYIFTHLGVGKTKTAKSYAERFKTVFSGHARSMIKNYKIGNLILRFPIFCIFQLGKAIKYSFKKRSILVLYSFFVSVYIFFINLSGTLNERKIIQSNRAVKDDVFLTIAVPDFL